MGERFLICIPKYLDNELDGILSTVARLQKTATIGGEVFKISARDYYCLKGCIYMANMNDQLRLGMTRGNFEK